MAKIYLSYRSTSKVREGLQETAQSGEVLGEVFDGIHGIFEPGETAHMLARSLELEFGGVNVFTGDRQLTRSGTLTVNGVVVPDLQTPGRFANMATYVKAALAQCAAMVVIIEQGWLEAHAWLRGRYLDDPHDRVRLEIETAFALGLTVIPVLVEDAVLPQAAHLPERLRALARLQPIQIQAIELELPPEAQHRLDLLRPRRKIAGLTELLERLPASDRTSASQAGREAGHPARVTPDPLRPSAGSPPAPRLPDGGSSRPPLPVSGAPQLGAAPVERAASLPLSPRPAVEADDDADEWDDDADEWDDDDDVVAEAEGAGPAPSLAAPASPPGRPEARPSAAPPTQPATQPATPPVHPAHIFLSYKSGDRDLVAALALRLSQQGHEVWFDQQLVGGQSWWNEILAQIRSANVFLFALTPAALTSQACQLEYTYAHGLRKRILPVMLAEDVDARLLPPALQQIQVVDYHAPEAGGWTRLTAALAALPPAAPLPAVLPNAPAAPVSPLGALKERIDARQISLEAQAYILFELKTLLKAPETADGALRLLRQFRYHADLRAAIADEIKPLISD
jgi:hypothetical protein